MTLTRGAVGAIIVLGALARLVSAVRVPLAFDEYQWLAIADGISITPPVHLPLHGDMHPVGSAYLTALSSLLAGHHILGYRLAAIVAGTVLIWIVWRLVSRQFGVAAGLTAAALIATNEYLIGVSRLAVEKSAHLALAGAAVLAFLNASERNRTRDFAWLGVTLGLGLLMKETLILLVPLLAWELADRHGWRALLKRGPAIALALALCGALPDLIWNLFLKADATGAGGHGLAEQAARFGAGWSWGPVALFFRPAIQWLERAVSEYPSMTVVSGALLLGGALASAFSWRAPEMRLWLRLGWAPFLFFAFFGVPRSGPPEFWWADLAVVPFVVLTAVGPSRASRWLLPLAVAVTIPAALAVVRAPENCYASGWEPSDEGLRSCFDAQRAFVATFPERDHASVSRAGAWRWPVADYYERWARAYLDWLEGRTVERVARWPDIAPDARPAEIERVTRMLRDLDNARNPVASR